MGKKNRVTEKPTPISEPEKVDVENTVSTDETLISDEPKTHEQYIADHKKHLDYIETAIAFNPQPVLRDTAKLRLDIENLKIGLNALTNLLIEKFVFTEEELSKELAIEAEKEAAKHKQHLADQFGADVAALGLE